MAERFERLIGGNDVELELCRVPFASQESDVAKGFLFSLNLVSDGLFKFCVNAASENNLLKCPSIDVEEIQRHFSPDYYISPEAVKSSIAHESIFNLIHQKSVIKVDCIVRKQSVYRQVEFERRIRLRVEDFETWIVSKEDLILSKLFWAKDSRSELQMRDVKNLILSGCDRSYIEKWTHELGVDSLWEEVSHD